MTDLERSYADLRAALIVAGRERRKLNFGRRYHPVLVHLRKVLRDARAVAPPRRPESIASAATPPRK